MNTITKKIFRLTVLTGSMILADGIVSVLCPGARGLVKAAACLASVTICGAAADIGSKHAIEVLENAQRRLRGESEWQK